MEPPGKESSLVVKSKKDVLGEINLEKMLSNLDNFVDLLQITFNAVDGFDVQDEVQELSNRFLDVMTESNKTALNFKLATEQVLEAYINAYGNLFYGEVETAMMLLTDTKGVAVQMVKKADEQKRIETEAMINELQGSLEAMEELKENLQNDIEQANADYEKLLKREMKQEERAYNMQLASMIIGAVSGLFGVASDTVSTAKKDREAAESQTESEMGETSAEVQAKRNYTENIGKLFWSNVETFCNSLASNESITKLIEMQRTKEPEQSAVYFKTIIFVKGYLGMVAKWQALYVIFEEYLRALAKVSKRMSETMEQELSDDRKVQWQLATKLSGKLNAKLQSEIDEII